MADVVSVAERMIPLANATDVADATPNVGVTSVGLVARTTPFDPVTFCPNAVATPVPNEVMPVPPLVTGSVPVTCDVKLTLDNVPPSVRLPEVVTVPVNVMPFTVPVPPTDVTVPVLAVAPSATFMMVLTCDAVKSSGLPVPVVILPLMVFAAMFAALALVTASSAMVRAVAPVTSPV